MLQNKIDSFIPNTFRFFYEQKKLSLILLFIMISFLIYGHFVLTGKFTASGDFGPAVSYVLNFKEAFSNGQWIPRWVIIPREVTLGGGTIDGTQPTADSPVFQYYAFLQSALAYPFLCLGIPVISSIQLVVIFAFAFSGIIFYKTGRVLGANRFVSFLSGYAYIMSPWLVSNFYERGGISESLGQSVLPLLMLGYAFALKNKYNNAMLSVAFGIFLLALSHNIFMLYGVILCCLLISLNFILLYASVIYPSIINYFKAKTDLPTHELNARTMNGNIRIQIILAISVAIGLAASAWQWMPAIMTLKELSFNYIGNFEKRGTILNAFADFSGIWGFPKLFTGAGKPEYFFTIGWWVIPGILSLLFVKRELKLPALAVFFSFIVFFVLTYWPSVVYPYLPGFFGATQFTFRLLAFLSVLGSFALCVGFPNMPRYAGIAIFLLITISQLPVIFFPMPTQQFPDEQYLRGYEYNAFYANSKHETHLRAWYSGWLEAENLLYLDNVETPAYLKITGITKDNIEKVKLFVAKVEDPAHPVSNIIEVPKGKFQAILKINKPENGLRIYALTGHPADNNMGTLSIRPEKVLLLTNPLSAFIPASDLDVIKSHGYKRIFSINKNKIITHQPNSAGIFTIELPIIYNKFSVPFQNGLPLEYEVDFNHRLTVFTHDLSSPITVQYSLPIFVWALTLTGAMMFLWLMGFTRVRKLFAVLKFNSSPVLIERS